MPDNYSLIVQDNLRRLYSNLPDNFEKLLPADRKGDAFMFHAFGQECTISPEAIYADHRLQMNVIGILISLYALHVNPSPCIVAPLKAFKDFPNTMPYVGAFATHTEKILIPHIGRIREKQDMITSKLNGGNPPPGTAGDFAFLVYPLPKIALCYIFYEADEDFPPAATCLYSSNAASFIPIDGLADIGEYTSRRICSFL